MVRPDTKIRILEAAEQIVLTRGVARLTLDAVAEAASLSKGGLIYHYDSKEALIAAMMDRLVASFEARVECWRREDGGPGSWTRGYVRASLPEPGSTDDGIAAREAALIAAMGNDPAQVAPYAARQEAWAEALRTDGIDPLRAMLIRLAADGIWMNEALGVHPAPTEERRRIVDALLTMARDPAA